jgi:hypothetical protein
MPIPSPEEFKEFAIAQQKLSEILDSREWFLGVGLGVDENQNFRISVLVDEDYEDALEIQREFERKSFGKYKVCVRMQSKEHLNSVLDAADKRHEKENIK